MFLLKNKEKFPKLSSIPPLTGSSVTGYVYSRHTGRPGFHLLHSVHHVYTGPITD